MSRKRLALILLGSPGSGKGTQSHYLIEWLGIPQISTGDMLREHIRKRDAIGLEIEAVMASGSLVSDELVNRLVRQRIADPDCERGFILDGYPRTASQAKETMRLVSEAAAEEVVIHLLVDYNEIIVRIAGRRVCPVCGTLYNAISRPTEIDGICDRDGARLEIRQDDREEVVRERLEEYRLRTEPLIEFFRKTTPRFHEVDASKGSPEDVFRKVRAILS